MSEVKVVHIIVRSVPVLDGGTIRSKYIVEYQRRCGIEPIVVTSPSHPGSSSPLEVINGIHYYRTTMPKVVSHVPGLRTLLSAWYITQRVLKVIHEVPVHLVHAHEPPECGLAGWWVAKSLGIPFIYEVRGFIEDTSVALGQLREHSWRYRYWRALGMYVMRRANKVVVISQTMAQDLVERGVKREQIVCVPNGVDTGLFSPKPREQTLSQILQIDSLVIGFIGSLRRLEGLDILIYAFRRILSEFPQVKLLIVGEGEDRKRLERMSEELGVRQKIIFTGLIDHSLVPMYYSLIDIVVFPRVDSRVNRLVTPLKPLEAQAMGKALIISDLPALKETVSPEQSHFTFRPGDIEGLADLCIRLLRDDHLRHELGRANRKYVVENRDWTLIVKKYNELYRLMGLPNH